MKEKVRPAKPHFFKPIQPGFKHALKIPTGFLKYLKGYDHIEHAILRRGSKQWRVKVNGCRFEVGWADFAQQHDLQLGDLLIFRHEGNMVFEVIIFDSSHCDREYAEYLLQEEDIVEEACKKFKFKDGFPLAEAATHNPFGQSHFECTVRSYYLTNGYMRVPSRFASKNGLIYKKCDLIIRDERQRSWNLKLYTSCDHVYIGGRWAKFHAANDLKVGDRIKFEVVTNGERPIWKFHVKPNPSIKSSSKAFPYAEAATHKPFGPSHLDSGHCNREYAEYLQEKEEEKEEAAGDAVEGTSKKFKLKEEPNPSVKSSSKAFPHVEAAIHKPFGHFVCTIRPYCLTYSYLILPTQFALTNGLINKKYDLIIRDEWQRSWNLMLRPFGTSVCIRGGWSKLRDTHCLKEGDQIMFEVVTDGTKPVWKFHGKISGECKNQSRG
ncbi:B3 domain-containing protein REM5 isoform X1 [Nicotiana tabacum]|uniref:B3 domain-containing protein REM5 isoform X1 n=1 Tax=Nicotiana tabacum TaxID=4097 RepID=A0AC58UJ16_TOBAC